MAARGVVITPPCSIVLDDHYSKGSIHLKDDCCCPVLYSSQMIVFVLNLQFITNLVMALAVKKA